MKTRAIITAIIAAASISSSAAQDLLTDGKVWNCVQRMYNDQTGEYDRPYTIAGIEGCVTAIDYITVNDIRTKRLTIERRGHLQYFVEGIGLSDDWQRYPIVNSYYNVLISVELNGVTIFTAEDFNSGTTGIRRVAHDTKKQPTYDLQGRKVAEPRHGILIKNGRKILK